MRLSPYAQTTTDETIAFSQTADSKVASSYAHDSTWAYRSNLDGMAVPELAGDTVLFSATNTAGPVNPYELATGVGKMASSNSRKAQKPCDNLTEMLGDLRFPVELPSNDPGPPPGYPPRIRADSDQVGLARSTHTQSCRRTTSETPPSVHRRPLPANALSDSLLTVHELSPSFATQNTETAISSMAQRSVGLAPSASELFSDDVHQSYMKQRRPYTAQQPQWSTVSPGLMSTRYYSAPPPVPYTLNEQAAAFSANSTSSWGLDTQPKVPKAPSAQEPATTTRMHSQKRVMDLLGSIGT